MADRSRRPRGSAVVVWLLATLLLSAATAVTAGTAATADEIGADVLRFEGGPEVAFALDDGRGFADVLELRATGDGGMVLINDVTMDDYLSGVAEMPPRWHAEALKAQAVAARTYAWRSLQRGTFEGRGYDICATVDCQVFAGTQVVEDHAQGQRWRQAVLETSDEVLLDEEGRPILARYFSTSGGQTLPNDLVFPNSGAFPYLVGVEDPDDEISPLHRWEVELTREEFEDVLSRGDTLSAAVPVAAVERRGEFVDPRAEVVVIGEDGTEVAVSAVVFREFVSRIAADRHPDRFPGRRDDGRPMPTTMPSSRFEVEVGEDRVLIEGRGWGHGVGMGQYGAHGKALRGLTYDEILASYYNGLVPQRHGDVPDRVRVGLDVADEVEVRGDGPVRILADGNEVAERALGGWRVEAAGGSLRLVPPDGRDEDLAVTPTRLATGFAEDEHRVVVEAEVNKPVELALHVMDEQGETVLVRDLGVADPGDHAATWRFADADEQRVANGDYRVALVATDEQGTRDGEPVSVTVERARDERGAPGLQEPGPVLAAVALLLVAGTAVAVARRRRRA
jgi:stage II sporulation protein D